MDFGTLLSEYGLAGIIIFALGAVVIYQQKLITSLYAKLFSLQDARRLENIETAKELSSTMSTFSQSVKMLVDKVVTVQPKDDDRP